MSSSTSSGDVTESLLAASIAGIAAATFEGFLTYPFDFIKTQNQLSRRVNGVKYDLPDPTKIIFRGSSALVLGGCVKSLARFSVYNSATKFMTDKNGQLAAPQVVVAGMMTGFVESLLIVPFESIKVRMVEATLNPVNAQANYEFAIAAAKASAERYQAVHVPQKRPAPEPKAPRETHAGDTKIRPKAVRPKTSPSSVAHKPVTSSAVPIYPIDPNVKSFFGNVRVMYRERGLRAFVQGFAPTLFRQVTFSTVQFTTYNFMKQLVHPKTEDPMPSYKAFGCGVLSGAAVVAATQPIDLLKTRMQTSNARAVYQSTPRAAYNIFVQEGPLTFWVGSFPRFIKVTTGSALTFAIYEVVTDMLKVAVSERPFSSS